MDRFETNFLDSYSDEGLLHEIRRVATVHAGGPLTKKAFQRLSGRVAASTVQRRFGGWKKALEKAGVGDLYGGQKISSKMTAQAARGMTEADLLAEMKRVHAQLGTGMLTKDDFDRTSIVTASGAIRGRFGSWKKAMEKAGIQLSSMGRRYTDEECFENLVAVWSHYGRPPQHDEMKVPPSVVGSKAYVIRWGTWRKALSAFVDWANADKAGSTEPSSKESTEEADPVLAPKVRKSAEDRHEVPLRLKWQVHVRDGFRCVACGKNPPQHGVTLHADHIVPWADGGKTILENLQTLCEPCNLGKGRSYGKAI